MLLAIRVSCPLAVEAVGAQRPREFWGACLSPGKQGSLAAVNCHKTFLHIWVYFFKLILISIDLCLFLVISAYVFVYVWLFLLVFLDLSPDVSYVTCKMFARSRLVGSSLVGSGRLSSIRPSNMTTVIQRECSTQL